jgi:hypothetical protein
MRNPDRPNKCFLQNNQDFEVFEKFEAVKKGTCANSFLLRATAVVVQIDKNRISYGKGRGFAKGAAATPLEPAGREGESVF